MAPWATVPEILAVAVALGSLGKTTHIIWVTPAVCKAISTALIWKDLVENNKITPAFIYFNFCLFWRKDIKTFCHPTDFAWILNLSGPGFFVYMQAKTWPYSTRSQEVKDFSLGGCYSVGNTSRPNTATGGRRETLISLDSKNLRGKLFVQRFSGLRKPRLSQSTAVRRYHTLCCFQTVPAPFMSALIPRMNRLSPGVKSSKSSTSQHYFNGDWVPRCDFWRNTFQT